MRTTFATALAIGVMLVIALPALAANLQSQSPPPAAAATPVKSAINLNTATVDQLETLPGIGRKTAERIIEYRTKAGGFKRIEELMNVKGIGEKSFLKLKPLVAVQPRPTRRPVSDAGPPLRLPRLRETGGAAFIDIIVAISLCLLITVIAVPVIGGTLDRERTIVGTQYLAGQLQRARLDSLKRARSVAVRLQVIDDRTQFRLFADGNGNGVLQHDIDRGIDPPLAPAEWLDDQARDVSLRINQDITEVAGSNGLAPGDDPLAHRPHVDPDVQPARQCHRRHALRRGASGAANGDSGIRSNRPCPRVDVRCADRAMAAIETIQQHLNAGVNAVALAAAHAGDHSPSFVPVSRSHSSTSAARRHSSNPRRGFARARAPRCSSPERTRACRSRVVSIAATSPRSSRFDIAASCCSTSASTSARIPADRRRVAGARDTSRDRAFATRRSAAAPNRVDNSGANPRITRAQLVASRLLLVPSSWTPAPTLSIAIPRQWRRADRRAGLDQLLRHVASDLVNATDRRHLSHILTERLRQLVADSQCWAEGNHQHDAAAIGAAGPRPRLRRLCRSGARRGTTGDAGSLV